MAEQRNFLLGRGERLTEPVIIAGRPIDRQPPYTFGQARTRILPMVQGTARIFDDLPDSACPNDEAVGALTLNPEYIAKSYFPNDLLRAVGLRLVGSRGRRIKPERRSRGRDPQEVVSTELFVAGRRKAFRDWARAMPQWSLDTRGADELAAVEEFHAPTAREKIKPIHSDADELVFEIVLHASAFKRDAYILEAFESFVGDEGLTLDLDRRIHTGGLCFLGLEASREKIKTLAQFSFLRVAREMPRLRMMRPLLRGMPNAGTAILPSEGALDPNIRVAVFDGGIPKKSPFGKWLKSEDAAGTGAPEADFMRHGHGVTSALLFGTLESGKVASRPFSNVNHYRILDEDSENDPFELIDVLERIKSVLSTNTFDFINLSVGPAMPVDDGDVHAWTSVLDDYLSDGKMLAAIAVGNNGEADEKLGYNRVQVPSDCVNGLAVGARDRRGKKWQRAAYSAVGPGRSPGIVKPDLLGFGGCQHEPFLVLEGDHPIKLSATCGTSYATPYVLRSAIGLRAHFGQLLSPLAIKALLVHCADPKSHPQSEVGWGRIPEHLDDLVTCPDGVVRVVYQGELTAGKYLRAALPLPVAQLHGDVEITATFCYATTVDTAHPTNYTRGGLDIVFRPNKSNHKKGAMHAKSAGFFRAGELYPTEDELRRDAHKWETCLHATVKKRGSGLKEPAFDIHYNTRAEGHSDRTSNRIPYALVITVESPRTKNLYDLVVRRYRTVLEPLNPVIHIPVRT